MSMVRRSLWMVALLVMAFAAVAQAQVVPDSAVYDEATNVLSIYFSGTVRTEAGFVPIGELVLDDDNGGLRDNFTLTSGQVVNTSATGSVVQIRVYAGAVLGTGTYTLSAQDFEYSMWGNDLSTLKEIESVLSHTNLSLIIPAGAFVTPADAAVSGGTVSVRYVTDPSPTTLVSGEYIAAENKLRFTFSRKVKFDEVAEDAAIIDTLTKWPGPGNGVLNVVPPEDGNGNNNGVLDMGPYLKKGQVELMVGSNIFSPSGSSILTLVDSTVIEFGLTYAEQELFESYDLSSGIEISFPAFTFLDQNFNSVSPVTDETFGLVPDPNPLELTSATYDMGSNQFVATFNKELGTAYSTRSRASRFTFNVLDSGSEVVNSFTLEIAGSFGLSNSNTSLAIGLLPSDAMGVETMIDSMVAGETMQVAVDAFATIDLANNGNIAGVSDVVVTPETATMKGPELSTTASVTYDAELNELVVPFDLSLEKAIDSTRFYVNIGDLSFTMDGCPPTRVQSNKAVSFALTDDKAKLIESAADKNAITVTVEPYAVLQFRFKNGNRLIEDAPVTYTASTLAPLIKTVFYDLERGVLYLESSNSEFAPSGVDLTKITLAGVQLSAADSAESVSAKGVDFYLPAGVVSSLSALGNDVIVDPTIGFEAGAVTNLDGVASLVVADTTKNGDVLTNGTDNVTVAVGFGRQFTILSYEFFTTDPRTVMGFIKRVSDNAYWYVDSEAIAEEYVSNTSVDNAVNFFQDSTPYDASMGAREVLMDAYAPGSSANLIPDMVTFLFVDILDEYGLGRNDTNDKLWKSGYVEASDDMIYLDCNPSDYGESAVTSEGLRQIAQLYGEYMTYKLDPFEQTWLRKGLANFGEFLIGGRDMSVTETFTQPLFQGAGAAIGFPGGNDLTFIGNDLKDRVDYQHAYLFLLYLYEKYGEGDMVGEIASSPRVGVEGLQKILDGNWAAGMYESGLGLKDKLTDIYLDFATAILLDMEMPAQDPGMGLYKFANMENSFPGAPGAALLWSPSTPPPYAFTGTNWGFAYVKTAYNPGGGVTLPLITPTDSLAISAGAAGATLKFRKVNFKVDEFTFNTRVDYNIQEIDASSGGAVFPISNGPDWTFGPATNPDAEVRMSIIVTAMQGGWQLTNDLRPASYVKLFISQNSLYSRKIDAFVVSSEQIFSEPGVEAPVLTVTQSGDTVASFSATEDYVVGQYTGSAHQYYTSAWLNESGSYSWSLSGSFANGRSIGTIASVPVDVTSVGNGESSVIAMDDHFQLRASSQSFDHSQYLSVVANSVVPQQVAGRVASAVDRDRVSAMYSLAAEQKDLSDPAVLTLPYDKAAAGSRDLGVYFNYHGQWVYVGGTVDADQSTITTRIGKLGDYQVMAGQLGEIPSELALPTEFALKQNYPNPFNPTTTIAMVLPNAANVHLVIFDVLGREVVRLVDGPMSFGAHKVIWDGRNAYGQPLASGVYFVQMRATDFSAVRKMVLVK